MLIEQLIFIIIAFALFVYMFYQLIKKNDTKYVPILAIQALGIAIDFIQLYFTKEDLNVFGKIIIYIFHGISSILLDAHKVFKFLCLSKKCNFIVENAIAIFSN